MTCSGCNECNVLTALGNLRASIEHEWTTVEDLGETPAVLFRNFFYEATPDLVVRATASDALTGALRDQNGLLDGCFNELTRSYITCREDALALVTHVLFSLMLAPVTTPSG